ncbi:MAG: hypothetical protein O3A08_11495 [Proteobacteria bacterium]|nr:hypothetical protein [Pseudomonadota bacterium]
MGRLVFGLLLFVYTAFSGGVLSAKTILTVESADGNVRVAMTLEDLQHLTQTGIKTSNEFVDGVKSFRGPLARLVLLQCKGGTPETLTLTAANDYQIKVQAKEFFDYDVILALSMDGVLLSSRDKGPIWVIYPMSQHAELRDPVFNTGLIWQLNKMDCR